MQNMWQKYQHKNQIKKTHGIIAVNTQDKSVQNAKKFMRDELKKQTICDWDTRVRKLTFQGDFIKLQTYEKENVFLEKLYK